MLRSKDLMIGDWVYSSFYNHPVRIAELYQDENGYGFIKTDEKDDYSKSDASLSPIPLTEEILEKNGFEKYGPRYAGIQQWATKEGERISLVQCISDGTWGLGDDLWIESVHELQNWLHLRKKTKKIVL